MGKVYYMDGKIGDNDFRTFLLTTTGQLDGRLSKEFPTWEGAIGAINEWFIERGFDLPIRKVVLPYLKSVGNIGPMTAPFPFLYEADMSNGDPFVALSKNVGELYIYTDKKTYTNAYGHDLNTVPYIDYSVSPASSGKFIRVVVGNIPVGIGDCVIDNKVSFLGKTFYLVTVNVTYHILDSIWEAQVRIDGPRVCDNSLFEGGHTEEYIEDNDPFLPGGGSDEGGGGGDFNNTSVPVEIPPLPEISAASTGFISLFNPSIIQLNELSSYLWSDLFEIDGWKKLFADPMDAILGLSILPVSIPPGGTREVKVGNIGTGISLTLAASQFVEVDCGSIDVNEYWGAYLDYEPYTQAQIFLPYIGTRPISVDEIMGKTVRVVYHVDILTGACCCFVKCGDSVLYTYNGQCSIPIPITSVNYTSVVNGVINIAASVGSLVSTGGASAPTAIPAIASSAVNQMKPQIEKSGSISGSAGILNMQTPYLILVRPRQALPSRQNEFIGYPSLITVQLTELSGYTEVQSIHLEGISATQEELAEIQSLLMGGVIF